MLIGGLFISLGIGIMSVYFAQWRGQVYLLKFLVTFSLMVLIAGNLLIRGFWDIHSFLILAAFLFSLAGDYQLSLKKEQGGFLRGVGLFFFAHVFYLTAFLVRGGFNLLVLCLSALVLVIYYVKYLSGNIEDKGLGLAVFVYMLISILVFSASAGTGSLFFTGGAFLILLSDAVIGWNSFYRPVKYDELVILSTYYCAQILVSAGVLILF